MGEWTVDGWEPIKEIKQIREMLDTEEILCQLAEEAAELAQAALKLRRAITGDNPTHIPKEEAQNALTEEIADVELALDALGVWDDDDISAWISGIMEAKSRRWADRLKERWQDDCESCINFPPSSLDSKPCSQCVPDKPLMNCYQSKEDCDG